MADINKADDAEARRAAIEAAFEQAEQQEEAPETEVVAETTEEPVVEQAEHVEEVAETPETTEAVAETPAETVEEEPAAAKADEPAAQPVKAPAGWKADAREHWAKLPPEVQREVERREKETAQALWQSQEDRKFAAEMRKVAQPYEALLKSAGVSAPRAFEEMIRTEYQLRTLPAHNKAQLVAQMIKSYGIDINALDAALTGQAVEPAPEAAVQQELNALKRELAEVRQAPQRQHEQQQIDEITRFAKDAKNEFFEDVRVDMAGLLNAASMRGQELSLQEAYDMACWARPEIRKVLNARTINSSNELASKKAASASVKGAPRSSTTKVAPTNAKDLRAVLEAAMQGGGERL